MQLHIAERNAHLVGDEAHEEQLAADLPQQLVERHDHAEAAEALGVGIARMGTGPHAPRLADPEQVADRRRVAGMSAAGDGGARNDFEQVLIGPHAFAQIGVEIDRRHLVRLRNSACACSTVTGSKATDVPGRICAKRSKSAEMTVAMRG